jgi:hypothetical protein
MSSFATLDGAEEISEGYSCGIWAPFQVRMLGWRWFIWFFPCPGSAGPEWCDQPRPSGLETQFQSELEIPGIEGAGSFSEFRTINAIIAARSHAGQR